jgi:low affinity Fe/Cu permease
MSEKKKRASLPVNEVFHHFARTAAAITGSAWAFIVAALIIVLWLISGPFFKFSDTWQLFINTGTTILTFLMVFLIQNTQNRDAVAMHLKLDELIRAVEKARNQLVDLEDLSDEELARLQKEFARLSKLEDEAIESLEEKKERAA